MWNTCKGYVRPAGVGMGLALAALCLLLALQNGCGVADSDGPLPPGGEPPGGDTPRGPMVAAGDADTLAGRVRSSMSSGETIVAPWSPPAQGKPVDMIWVIDESGSMMDNRAALAGAASYMLKLAKQAKIDLRIGITGVVDATSKLLGKFCSSASTSPAGAGGVDRFLDASEVSTIMACMKNPPGAVAGLEYTQLGGAAAVTRHLPRKVGDPARIRKGAELVVVYVTDETSQGVKSALSMGAPQQCSLGGADKAALAKAIQQELAMYAGTPDPETAATVHMIGGLCKNSCNAEIGHGMIEIAGATGGLTLDVCAPDLKPAVKKIIDALGAAPPPPPPPPAAKALDLVLVVDESGSMMDNLAVVKQAVSKLVASAKAAKIDLRVGVTGVVESSSKLAGKFCSSVSTSPAHAGGVDRFLAASELSTILGCIANPPGAVMGTEHTLAGGVAAVKRHLPRKAGDTSRIRPKARLAVVHITDEMSNELMAKLPTAAGQQCVLSKQDQAIVDAHVAPHIKLYSSQKATAHMVGGVCKNTCGASIGHGMIRVAGATGGVTADVCLTSLDAAFASILKAALK